MSSCPVSTVDWTVTIFTLQDAYKQKNHRFLHQLKTSSFPGLQPQQFLPLLNSLSNTSSARRAPSSLLSDPKHQINSYRVKNGTKSLTNKVLRLTAVSVVSLGDVCLQVEAAEGLQVTCYWAQPASTSVGQSDPRTLLGEPIKTLASGDGVTTHRRFIYASNLSNSPNPGRVRRFWPRIGIGKYL